MPDTPEKPGNARPDKDRRRHPRQRIHSLSYAKMGDSNGGIVLNISEGGISIQAAAVLDAGEKMPIWLEIPRVREKVEVTGEIVWLSSSRKEAGLRFVDLPESKLQLIRKWMAREASPEQFEDEIEPAKEVPVAAMPHPAQVRAREGQKGVRELVEANIMSAEEIRIFESGGEPDEALAGPVSALVEEEREADDSSAAEIEEDLTEKAKAEVAAESETEDEGEVEHKIEHAVRPEPKGKTETGVERPAASRPADKTPAQENAQTKADVSEPEETTELEKQPEKKPESEEEVTTEDELIEAFGPPVVPFERKAPHAPFSSLGGLSGELRGLSNVAPAAAVASEVPAGIFAPTIAPGMESPSGWKGFQVQLQTGWFLAALVLLLALISFIAGMAVRRGALNDVLAEQQDAVAATTPGSSAVPQTGSTAGTGANGTASPNATASKPLSIEIVDTSNRHWTIPASTGANRTSAATTPDALSSSTNPAVNPATTSDAGSRLGPDSSSPAAANSAASRPTNTGKPDMPLVLSLPETPISASGSVAISAQRSVAMPANGADAEKNARNLQVGQLTNLVEPVYPAEAVQQKIEGTVKLHAVIGTDGAIESLAQVSGPQMLVNASMVAVRNWKYSPTRMNGRAIETQEDISFVFRLPN